jgi:hypothetical protein
MTASDYYKKFPPRGPVSKMAVRLVSVVNDESITGLEGADLLTIPKVLDAELQEVREVIGLAAHPKFETADGRIRYYLTRSDVEAARALMEKLKC